MSVHAYINQLYLINCPHRLIFKSKILYPEERPSFHLSHTRLQKKSLTHNPCASASIAKQMTRTTLHREKKQEPDSASRARASHCDCGRGIPKSRQEHREPSSLRDRLEQTKAAEPPARASPAAASPGAVRHRGAETGAGRGWGSRSRGTGTPLRSVRERWLPLLLLQRTGTSRVTRAWCPVYSPWFKK